MRYAQGATFPCLTKTLRVRRRTRFTQKAIPTLSISAEQERSHYDRAYGQHLEAPGHALACSRDILLRQIRDPASPMYERRLLYGQVLDELLAVPVNGLTALDYGCGTGEWGVMLATEGARAALLDLSPVAIDVARRRAEASGVLDRVRLCAQDASDLSEFEDGEFDLVYAGAALHHTLKYPNAFAELLRVLKPGGRLVMAEGYGNNRLLSWARRTRQRLAGEPVEAGEGIVLGDAEIRLLEEYMARVDVTPLNLFAMAKRLFRGRFTSPAVRRVMRLLESLDAACFRRFPSTRRLCGEAVIVCQR